MQLRFFSKKHQSPGCSLHVWNSSRSYLLVNHPGVWFKKPTGIINSAILLPDDDPQMHSNAYMRKHDLSDLSTPNGHPHIPWQFLMRCYSRMGKSSLNIDPGTQVLWQLLQLKWIGPKTYRLNICWKRRPVITYQESHYAFVTAHVSGMLCKERGLLTAFRQVIKNKEEFLALLVNIFLPPWVPWFQWHQLKVFLKARGYQGTDLSAQQVAQRTAAPTDIPVTYCDPLLSETP